jgi:hypothetical protein
MKYTDEELIDINKRLHGRGIKRLIIPDVIFTMGDINKVQNWAANRYTNFNGGFGIAPGSDYILKYIVDNKNEFTFFCRGKMGISNSFSSLNEPNLFFNAKSFSLITFELNNLPNSFAISVFPVPGVPVTNNFIILNRKKELIKKSHLIKIKKTYFKFLGNAKQSFVRHLPLESRDLHRETSLWQETIT